jgi:hypothetical protein
MIQKIDGSTWRGNPIFKSTFAGNFDKLLADKKIAVLRKRGK